MENGQNDACESFRYILRFAVVSSYLHISDDKISESHYETIGAVIQVENHNDQTQMKTVHISVLIVVGNYVLIHLKPC